ncbi:chromosome segregation protein SMC [Bacillus cereus]|uniref:chromosome segregation protein SMC n=1 Tax=Bacillus cereus TaxID=1396 RepID=UPI000994017D|nr:chromosome segregation protein SMC [Bacillus cereus]OOQ91950.1 chromosome segregation protein SMC [Bacillus cereus]
MATEREMELAKQILAKLTEMDSRLEKLDGKMDKLDNRMDSLEGKMHSSEGIFKGLQATFQQGFADVHKELAEIKQINKNRKSAREIVEGIAGNGK